GHVAAADPRWLKLGLAAALGVVAGTMLFATEAHGRTEGRGERRLGRQRP
ncbi:MAG: short-chain dehydrogenase, partial [Actinomycetospora chiangmaiensis]|nr:short-chain dehydrogenase [Actinomycetospora chiangmaiensis]